MYITLKEIVNHTINNSWHELIDNLNFDNNQSLIEDEFNNDDIKNQPVKKFRKFAIRGLSLLRPLPYFRTCKSANIDEEYCVCEKKKKLKFLILTRYMQQNNLSFI